ncbi:MAG: methyltransferase domain-containing protein [Thermodesulfovibrio sp.]|uniref:class I SAM-dependent methyltransferase n=1 Tax=unclassified Thermodesulfovibrio TaxID=2645936 RepID=UPI00083AE37D|nr:MULTISPECIES: class I SAM-dependent methyltransferase [unclassified Thermodesulfovibrio]MDI1472727.1 methyltransferase domain-containing protein [Thermodesulfovibrio sp. 1176]MDI6713425.1 methyltransferase domain-containing protein [Thermodesulfovibrio sp.]ODA44464.1 Methyltransferase type 11 [Thermodesulfovibrio sp. N1]
MKTNYYLMENNEEIFRLELKTDTEAVKKQAKWAGIKPGMKVADIGCGAGITTVVLYQLVQPGGEVLGIDSSIERINYAKENYGKKGIEFKYFNILEPLNIEHSFDFIWVRFLLEYYRRESFEIVKNISKLLKPGGILCLIDLDHNCLNHYQLPPRLEKTLFKLMNSLESEANFDPYIGRKLYSMLYDLGFTNIKVKVEAHHLIYGKIKEKDVYNWFKKIEVVSKKIKFKFEEYEDGYDGFLREFKEFFLNSRRFTYTPLILCRGQKSVLH